MSGTAAEAARLVPGLISEVGAIAFDRVAGSWRSRRDGVPTSVDAANANWLNAALGGDFPGAGISGVERLGGHAGTTVRERLRLQFDAGIRPDGVPDTVFLKITPAHPGSRVFTSLLGLGASEVAFYRALGDSLPVRVPRVYCARSAARGGRFVLLMEDLEAAGCRFPGGGVPLDGDEARSVVTALGRLHAAFWESPRLRGDLAWLRSPENNPSRALEWWMCARSNDLALARFGDALPREVRGELRRIHENRPLLEAHWAGLPRTLIHGDSHAGNVFFDGDEAGLFDWQVVQSGPGLRDVAYFLVNSLDGDVRRAHERGLLGHYAATLAECGGPVLDPAEAWEQYRLFALYTWIAVSVTAAAASLQSREVVQRAVERTGRALVDLDALEALERLGSRR